TVADERQAGALRWGASLAAVLALHALLALYAMSRHIGIEPAGLPPSAVMVDLAPLPAPAPPVPAPPEPAPQPEVKPPPEPEPRPEVKPEVKPPPEIPKPAVTLPKKPHPKPRPVERRPPPPAAAEPQAIAPPAPAAAAPAPSANTAAERASWQAQLVGWLERYKRYPRLAREQRQEGIVSLHFAIDRQGHVLDARIARGSGDPLLDEEALALVQRAQPLPAPPPDIAGTRVDLVVPIRFALDRR